MRTYEFCYVDGWQQESHSGFRWTIYQCKRGFPYLEMPPEHVFLWFNKVVAECKSRDQARATVWALIQQRKDSRERRQERKDIDARLAFLAKEREARTI